MAEFKAMLEALGYTHVKTLLNSGNAVFASADRATEKHAKSIATALQEKLAVATPVVVKSEAEFKAAVAGNPKPPPEAEWSGFLVAFGPDQAALQALEPLGATVREPESFSIGTAAAYLHCPGGLLASKAAESMLGKAGRGVTARNWATVLKLEALLSAA